jgi:FtsP/CotA-like multicopper oxidase with cupredoxin domain
MKRILLLGLAALLVVVGGLGVIAVVVYSRADVSTVGELSFSQRLRIPPLLEPRADASGRRLFDLTLQQGRAELLPGARADTWGVNGPYLGPTLRASRGDRLQMSVRNDLPETTTLHWHGMHLPPEADGGPHQMIEPGERWQPSWTVDQPAATLWYHPHLHGDTEDHVYRGVAGMFILDDPRSRALALPDDYGVDDIPVILQDPRLSDDGALEFSQGAISPIGRLGDTTLVNGTFDPYLPVSSRRVRLRLLNASTARIYDVGFDDSRELLLIGADGGLLEVPRPARRVLLSPGERAEVVAEFRPGERAVLRSFEPDLGADFFNDRFSGGDDSFDLLEVRAARELAPAPAMPDRMSGEGIASLDPSESVRTRRFELSGSSSINGRSMDLGRIDEVATRDTTEVWEVENSSDIPHSFHPHDVRFRVLDYAGRPPPPEVSGLQDTVFVPPHETMRLVTRFEDYTNPDVPYMFHCHVLEHEDRGMMGQLVVVEPGEEPGSPPSHEAAGD